MKKLICTILTPITLFGMFCEDARVPVPSIEVSRTTAFAAGAALTAVGAFMVYKRTFGQLRRLHAQYERLQRDVTDGFAENNRLHAETHTKLDTLGEQELKTRTDLKASAENVRAVAIQEGSLTRSRMADSFVGAQEQMKRLERKIDDLPDLVVAALKKVS